MPTKRGYDGLHKYALTMKANAQITCGGSEADVDGNHVILPCESVLLGLTASGLAGAALAACDILAYHGTTKSGTVVCAAMDLKTAGQNSATADPVAGYVGKILPKGAEFCISEDGTNTKTIDQLQVTLWLRDVGA